MIKPRLTANSSGFSIYRLCNGAAQYRLLAQRLANQHRLALIAHPAHLYVGSLKSHHTTLFWYKLHRIMLPILLIISAGASFADDAKHLF